MNRDKIWDTDMLCQKKWTKVSVRYGKGGYGNGTKQYFENEKRYFNSTRVHAAGLLVRYKQVQWKRRAVSEASSNAVEICIFIYTIYT